MRWLKRLLLALLALASLLVAAAWLTLRASLPVLDGEQSLPGLTAVVSIERDALGTVICTGSHRGDVAAALGYVHAQERFFEMDLLRRRAAGELAALLGAAVLPADREARVHRFRQRAQGFLSELPESERALLRRYTEGVNAGLAALSARPFPYLLLGQAPQPWTEIDSLLVPIAMYFTLQEHHNRREWRLLQMRAALPPAVHAFLTAAGTPWDSALAGDVLPDPPIPGPEAIDLRTTDIADPAPDAPPSSEGVGSNNFAIAGRVSIHGGAILANDMHLGLRAPNLWFRAELRWPDGAGGEHVVTGVTLPGIPFVVAGSNGHIAWGYTNSYGDWLDFVAIEAETGDESRYRTPEGSEPYVYHRERIAVRGAEDAWLEVRETRFGPVVAESPDGQPLALQWVAHHAAGVNTGLGGMETTRDIEGALAVARHTGMPAQNLLVAGRDGRVAWSLMGRIPARGGDGLTPLASNDPAAAWQGFVEGERNPHRVDPPDGRLWTANARVASGAEAALIGDGGYTIGARGGQIRDGLRAKDRLSEQDLLAIQLDDRALFLARWHSLLQEVVATSDDPAVQALAAGLADWDGRASIESSAYRISRAFRLRVHKRFLALFEPLLKARFADFAWPTLPQIEGAVWATIQARPLHLLPRNHASWNAWLEAAARDVALHLSAAGIEPADATWGRQNTTRIRHPLSAALPGLGHLLDMPAQPLPGDQYMPRVQGPSFGASERMVVSPGRESEGLFHMPGGQSGHPLSPYYGAGHADWARGSASPFLPGPAEHRLRLQP